MRWLRDFFKVRDPIVKVAGALSEPEAEMWRELLDNNGIPAMVKVTDVSAFGEGRASGLSADLYVKESDVERAGEVLSPILASRERPRRHRRRPE